MNNLSFELHSGDIVICPYEVKKYILMNKDDHLLNIKFLDKNELVENLNFNYSLDAITYLNDSYNYSYQNSKEVLDNLKKINSFNECSDKIKNCIEIYEDLKEHKLLEFNPYFSYLFEKRKIKVVGYSSLDSELVNLLNKTKASYEFIPFEIIEKKYQKCLVFDTIHDEVNGMFNEICRLISNGVNLNNIYLYQYNSEYNYLIDRYARYLNIKFSETKFNLNKLPIYSEFINNIKSWDIDGLVEAYNSLNNKFGASELKKIIVQVKNCKITLELLDFLSKDIYVKGDTYLNKITIIDDYIDLGEDDYLFMIGFTYGDYPKVRKDIDFFSDKEKLGLGINTSLVMRSVDNDTLKGLINSASNIYLSYYLSNGKIVNNVSLIASELNLKFTKIDLDNIRYSKVLSEIEVADLIDKKHFYGVGCDYVNTFTEDEISYKSYDNSYNGKLPYNDEKLKLSYSQINEYNECHFKYYLDRILNLDSDSDTFFTRLGSMCHKILEDSISKDINEKDLDSYIDFYFSDIKEKYFAKKLSYQILDVIEKNSNFIKDSSLEECKAETEINYNIDAKTILNGKIDKFIFNKEYNKAIIVDYKTGKFRFNKKKIPYGLGMQLLIYALLLENSNPNDFYKDLEILGIYIQKILYDTTNKEERNSNHYLLNGLTIGGEYEVKFIDSSIENNSNYLKSISLTAKGKIHGSAKTNGYLINRDEFNELKEQTKHQINTAVLGIRNSDFSIRPIIYDKESPCTYCNFNDICYVRGKDKIIIDPKEGKSNGINE